MKKLLALLIVAVFASSAMAADKKPVKAPAKKEVKHHKKAEGTEITGTKPDTVKKKK